MKTNLTLKRILDVPAERAWQAWTVPELVMRWWPPEYFSSPSAEIDFREGGRSIVAMRSPKEFGGGDTYTSWVYKKIIPFKKIEFINNLSDEKGNEADPSKYGLPRDFPRDMRFEVIFKDLGDGRTEIAVTQYGWTAGKMMEMGERGLNQSLDKMVRIFAK